MGKVSFSELVNIDSLKKMLESIYGVSEIPIGIMDVDGTINITTGWQDICTKYHRVHKDTCKRCSISDQYISEHIRDGGYISYKCLNNMWEIALPIVISGEHMATIILGQFFYEDEVIDIEHFRAQAIEFGFNEKDYMDALSRVPIYSKKKVENIIEYCSALVMTLAESGLSQLEYKNSQNELEKSQKYLNTIFNSVNDSIFIHDVYGNILDVNETTTTMFGYSKDELISMNVYDIVSENPDGTEFDFEILVNRARNNETLILEYVVKNKSSKEFWIEVNIHIANIHEEEIILVTARDITERKQNELALQNEAREIIPNLMKRTAEGIASGLGAKIDFRWYPYLPVVNNSARFKKVALEAATEIGYRVAEAQKSPGGEDFAFYQTKIPAYPNEILHK